MKINKSYFIAGFIIALTLSFGLSAHADEWDHATSITFNHAIQIPGQVLPAGTYFLKLVNSDSDRNIVQIFNSDQTHVFATLDAVAAERQDPTDDTVVTFAEQGVGKPDVLVRWFYPGDVTGVEFLYSGQTEKELAQERHQTVLANQQPITDSEHAGSN
jgi:hypothetical protein